MQSASVIDVFDEGAYVGSGLLDRGIGLGVDLLLLQGSHEALGLGVVVGVAGPAHAGSDPMGLQPFAVFMASILHAAVGVVDETRRGTAGRQRHVERLDSQARRLEATAEGPSFQSFVAAERTASPALDGRSDFGWEKDLSAKKIAGS